MAKTAAKTASSSTSNPQKQAQSTSTQSGAIGMLAQDHRKAEGLFNKFEQAMMIRRRNRSRGRSALS